jgi:thioredoxin-related protein
MNISHKPLAAAILLMVVLACSASAIGDQIVWLGHDEGLASGKTLKKKVFINFYADWCTWCRKLEKETFRDKAVVAYLNRHFIAVKVDSDRRQDLAAAYGVQGLPTMWFVTDQGEPISALQSFVPADTFVTVLRFIATDSYKHMKYNDFARSENQGQK